jgi:thioredoxin 1
MVLLKEVMKMAELYRQEDEHVVKKKLKEMRAREHGQKTETPIIVTDNTLSQIIKEYPLVVIDCWAEWCGPCHMIAPVVEELARDYSGKIVFGKLNTEENRMSANKYNIMSIPTLLVFRNGKLVDQVVGAMPRQELEPEITKHL